MKNKLSKTMYKKQLQIMKVFGGIFISNLVTWIPMLKLLVLLATAVTVDETPDWLKCIAFIALIFSAVVHPIIQASLIPELRSYLVSVWKNKMFWLCSSFLKIQTSGSLFDTNEKNSCNTTSIQCGCHCCDLLNMTYYQIEKK